jgi:hypothetical protein
VAPKWLAKDAKLAEDDQLRDLQLKWFADDIWMRRVRFWLFAAASAAALVATVIAIFAYPDPVTTPARRIAPILLAVPMLPQSKTETIDKQDPVITVALAALSEKR